MSYSRVTDQGVMLFDDRRNTLYAQAIRSAVRPGDVVLDLGAGLGIHGLLSAAAGASRVYLVEPQGVVNVAAEAARANGLSGSIVILQDKIENVSLPERVDVIASVFTGNLLFSEDLLPALFHARDRYLKPAGRLVPDRAQLWLAPLSAAALHAKYVARWSQPVMGLDYSAGRILAANEILWLRREDFQGSQRMAEGGVISDLDMNAASDADCRGEVRCTVTVTGTSHGLLGWIRVKVGETWMSTDPGSPEVHWSPVMLPVDPPLPLTAGEEVVMTLQRPAYGDWTWAIKAQAGTRRHSSFLGAAGGAKELRRVAPDAAPGLRPDGEAALRILTLLSERVSNRDIAKTLSAEREISEATALQQVQALALRYGGPA